MAAVDALRRVCDDFTSLMFYYPQNVYHNTIFNLALPGPAGNLELLAEFAGVGLEGWGKGETKSKERKRGKERRGKGKGRNSAPSSWNAGYATELGTVTAANYARGE